MLALFAFLLALSGGAFASPFHGPPMLGGGDRSLPAPIRFDGTSGGPDHGLPPPPPGGTSIGGKPSIGGPVQFDGTSGGPDRP
jgi:hypothetical protein